MARPSLEAPHMNPRSMPFVIALLGSIAVTLTASLSRASTEPLDDEVADHGADAGEVADHGDDADEVADHGADADEVGDDHGADAEDEARWDPWSSLARASFGRPVLGASGSSPSVSLVGFTRTAADDRREVGGFLVVEWPLDRLAPGTSRVVAPAPALFARADPAAGPAPAEVQLTRASSSEQPFALALTPRLARACVRAAWRAAGLGPDDARLDGIVSRARWSSLLPEARFRAIRSDDARSSLDTNAETSRVRDSAGANIGLEARLTFRLHRLVYSDDERSFERIRLELRDARTRIGARVLDALFHWQRATLDLQTLPPSQRGTRDEADVVLRVLEAEAALDVLTNGWFSSRGGHTAAVMRPPTPPRSRSESGTELPIGGGDL